jgi:hypothetical protein
LRPSATKAGVFGRDFCGAQRVADFDKTPDTFEKLDRLALDEFNPERNGQLNQRKLAVAIRHGPGKSDKQIQAAVTQELPLGGLIKAGIKAAPHVIKGVKHVIKVAAPHVIKGVKHVVKATPHVIRGVKHLVKGGHVHKHGSSLIKKFFGVGKKGGKSGAFQNTVKQEAKNTVKQEAKKEAVKDFARERAKEAAGCGCPGLT